MTLSDFVNDMIARKKAFVYHNRNWKAYVTVFFSSAEEMEEGVKLITGNPKASVYGISGFSSSNGTGMTASASQRGYVMWVNDRNGNATIAALAHEAVHIAGLILSDCGVSVNLRELSASECLAYLVEDIVRFGINSLEVDVKPKAGSSKPRKEKKS